MKNISNQIPLHAYTIFAQFDNQDLQEKLMNWAAENDCTILWGRPSSSDIMAFGRFVEIIDRDVLGQETYEMYLDYLSSDEYLLLKFLQNESIKQIGYGNEVDVTQDEVAEEVEMAGEIEGFSDEIMEEWNDGVCIIIDNKRDFELPQRKIVLRLDPLDERFIDFVLSTVQVAKKAKDDELRHKGFIC